MNFALLGTSALPLAALAAFGSSGLPPAATSATSTGTQAMLVFGDVDGDGLADALVLGRQGQLRLLHNSGAGEFLDITEASGLSAADGATCAVFFDADLDGDQDLFLGSGEARIWLNLGNALFDPAQSGIEHDLVDLAVLTVDTDRDGRLDLVARTEAGDLLYKNAGQGRFTRVDLPGSGAVTIAEDTTLDPVSDVDSAARSASREVDAEERPATRRMNRWLALQAASSVGASPAGSIATPGSVTPGGSGSLPFSLQCALNVRDNANGQCLRASSIPALGQLYPLTTNFNVNASGNVGIGTTTQTDKLVVKGGRMRIRESDGTLGSAVLLLDNGTRTNAIFTDGTTGDLFLRTDSLSHDIVIQDVPNNGNVGIGTATPSEKLDVLGNVLVSGTVTGNRLVSTVATGTAPMTVASTTKVTSLNADQIDGLDSTAFSQLGNSIESSEITNGTIGMADVGQNGAQTGQVIKWNGTAWTPATDGIGTGSQFLNLGVGSFVAVDTNNRVVNWYGQGVWSVGSAEIVAPIHLPPGAQVLSVQAFVYDTTATTNLNVNLITLDNSVGAAYGFGSPAVSFEVLAGSSGYYNQTFATNGTIDGTRSYHLQVSPTAAGWPAALSTLAVRNIRIEWRMP